MKPGNTELFVSRRDKLTILVEIISIAKKGAPKTHIMYQANISFASMNDYLLILLRKQLIMKLSNGNKTMYKSTEKGLAVLNLYSQLTELINENGNFEARAFGVDAEQGPTATSTVTC
jgi:predicted transcriptional regulator